MRGAVRTGTKIGLFFVSLEKRKWTMDVEVVKLFEGCSSVDYLEVVYSSEDIEDVLAGFEAEAQ